MRTAQPIDPFGHDIQGEADRLRAAGPCVPVVLPGGIEAWSITRQPLLKRLLTDPRVSKDPYLHWPAFRAGEIPETWPLYTWVAVRNMFTAYGMEHRRLRRLVAPAFTARRTEAMEPLVRDIVGDLLRKLAITDPAHPVDLRETYTHPLPIQVICALFGVPDSMRTDLRRAVDGVFNTAAGAEEVMATQKMLYGLLTELIAGKRAAPGDDMTSDLIATRDDEEQGLTEQELIDTLLLILSAGHETTVNLIGNAVHALLTHPDQLALVRAGEATWDDVIEETLRWAPSVASLPLRYAVEDIAVEGGPVISAGDAIVAGYAAAGRDPERYGPTAGLFDITRGDKEHLAFGHGVHRCLGAPMARMEARIALPALFDAFPGLRLASPADDLPPIESFIAHGFRSIPVLLG
ncbi:cytochrome P450 [Streptomyces sp. NPDC058955]|uniref:cytochrome P450 family protein n=1 Tax=unclassified Streptomyces TaxID=2593676 RepID=UPI00365FBF37